MDPLYFKHLDWFPDEDGQPQYAERRIVCACNRFVHKETEEIRLVTCVRHYSKDCYEHVKYLRTSGFKLESQGFLDQYSDYHSREDALKIAVRMKQITREKCFPEDELFSEDLY